ncbi:MAG: ABC transporter permease, partial [Flavobacteriales bacterium]|nr:ABC transporter permease [Flavobacteriales bacterium]MCB0782811.1 ABC transporter permease [Flavobacteriales bacterium]
PGSTFRPPGLFRQLEVYFRRDALAKLANRQYVLVNLLEAPVLALVMAFFLRYLGQEGEYVFRENDNVPQYLFIAVIVALFLGLTVAAEEIIRDRKILQREKFLDLSWGGYLASKVGIMFLISAVQTLFFVLIGNAVLGIQGMLLPYWLLLFSTACFANVLGLNVSASFNSAKVIYIVIPVLIIPQLLFSGIIVRFDKLHPWFASERSVPWIGNIMASRWAYEGLAVTQFMENGYERQFYEEDQRMRTANWRKDLWLRELRNVVTSIRQGLEVGDAPPSPSDVALLRTELAREADRIEGFDPPIASLEDPGTVDLEVLREVDASLDLLVKHYRSIYRSAERAKEDRVQALTATPALKKAYFTLMDAQRNESLAEFVTNKNDLTMIVRVDDQLVRKSDPIYSEPVVRSLFGAHFYAPFKWLGGERVPTLYANTLVLWCMTLLFMVLLWSDLFPRGGRALQQLVRSRR